MKFITVLFLFVCVLCVSCCEKPVEPVVVVEPPKPEVVPPDISGRVPQLPYGGDPRGTYYPNKPLVSIGGNGYLSSALEIVPPTINEGSGKLVISGAWATSGTWRTENFALKFDGKLKLYGSPYRISTVNHDSLSAFFRVGRGRWDKGDGSQIWFESSTNVFVFYYTADSLGMYLYTSPPRINYPPDANTLLLTTIFKKQR